MVTYQVVLKLTRDKTLETKMSLHAPAHIGEHLIHEGEHFKITKIVHSHECYTTIYAT